MATTNTAKRVLEKIRELGIVTPTQISDSCSLPSLSVRDSIELLAQFGQIEIITNGKTRLVKIKSEVSA